MPTTGPRSDGGVVCPLPPIPQQATAPASSTAHVCILPAARATTFVRFSGGVIRPSRSSPQHETWPFSCSVHVCPSPALIATTYDKLSAGSSISILQPVTRPPSTHVHSYAS